jgi:hypothetical protein
LGPVNVKEAYIGGPANKHFTTVMG